MPIQTAPENKIPRTTIKAIKRAVKEGIIVIVPAGNFGPLINTINPFTFIDGVISVGGAKNDGSDLCDFSSRGIPGSNYNRPTIVAPSENIIGVTHSGITSVLLEQKKLKKYLTAQNYYEQWGYKPKEEELEKLKYRAVIGSGTSQAVEVITRITHKIIGLRQTFGLQINPKIIRKILCDIARPIKNYSVHEIGCGFVNVFCFHDYLKKILDRNSLSTTTRRLWEKPIPRIDFSGGNVQVLFMDNSMFNQENFTDEEDLLNPLLKTGKSPFDEDFGLGFEDNSDDIIGIK